VVQLNGGSFCVTSNVTTTLTPHPKRYSHQATSVSISVFFTFFARTHTDKHTQTNTHRQTHTDKHTQTNTHRQTHTDRQTQTDRHTERRRVVASLSAQIMITK